MFFPPWNLSVSETISSSLWQSVPWSWIVTSPCDVSEKTDFTTETHKQAVKQEEKCSVCIKLREWCVKNVILCLVWICKRMFVFYCIKALWSFNIRTERQKQPKTTITKTFQVEPLKGLEKQSAYIPPTFNPKMNTFMHVNPKHPPPLNVQLNQTISDLTMIRGKAVEVGGAEYISVSAIQ